MAHGEDNVGQVRSSDWLQRIYARLLSAGGDAFFGNVTTANTTTNFKVVSMEGLGTNLFNDAYYCQIIQADAAAPEGEIQKVSAYDTSDGDITVGAAFTVAPEVGDYVIILHESVVAAIADSTNNLFMKDVVGNKTDASTIPSTTTSLVAMLKKVYDEVVGITIAGELFYVSGPAGLEIDDVGTYNIGLYDVGDGIPTAAEITEGNYQIDRIRDGATTNIVASTGASKADGRIYCTETFDAASGWAVGDLVMVTFSGGSVTPTGGATTVLPNAYMYSRIVRGEVIQSLLVDGLINGTGTVLPANKSVYDEVALDRLDNATYGLSALNDDLDSLLADIGDASGSTLTSLYAILGNPSASLAATILDGIDARANNPTLNALLGVTDVAGYSINGNLGNFQAQTNLQTLLAALGIPDVAAKPLYTCIVTDRIDNVTYGLSALNDDLDTIITDTEKIYDVTLGVSPANGALASFIATGGTALGTRLAASVSILDALGHDGVTDLDSGIMAQLQDYVTDDIASIYGRLGAYTGPVGGAAQDDNVKASLDLAHTDLDTIITATDKLAGATPSVGTATQNWNTAEADIVSIGANDTNNKLHSLVLSIDEITAASIITIRMYMQTNGVERKVYDQDYTKDSDPDGLWIVNGTVGIHEVLRVTAESDTAADDGKNIDYDVMLEVM